MSGWSRPLGESWRAWIALAIGVLAVSAHSALSFGMSPLLKPITDELGWSRTQYASAMNFRILILTLVVPFAGTLVDRMGARLVLSLGALAMGLGTLGLAGSSTLSGLYLLGLIIGPGQAFISSVVSSALVLRLFQRHRGIALGILNGGDNLITSMVHVATATMLVRIGWRGALGGLAAGYVVLAALIALVLRSGEGMSEAPATRAAAGTEAGEGSRGQLPWRDPRLWLILVSYASIYAFVTSIGIHFPAYLRDLGRDPEQAARIYGLSTLVGAFGSVACGWLSERTSARTTLSIVIVGLLATSLVLWFPAGDGVLFAWAVAYGIANAGVVALLALVLDEIFGDARIGRLMGVAMMSCMAATMVGNYFAAATHDQTGSYLDVWRVYTVMLALTLIPVEILRRWPRTGAVPVHAELQRGT